MSEHAPIVTATTRTVYEARGADGTFDSPKSAYEGLAMVTITTRRRFPLDKAGKERFWRLHKRLAGFLAFVDRRRGFVALDGEIAARMRVADEVEILLGKLTPKRGGRDTAWCKGYREALAHVSKAIREEAANG